MLQLRNIRKILRYQEKTNFKLVKSANYFAHLTFVDPVQELLAPFWIPLVSLQYEGRSEVDVSLFRVLQAQLKFGNLLHKSVFRPQLSVQTIHELWVYINTLMRNKQLNLQKIRNRDQLNFEALRNTQYKKFNNYSKYSFQVHSNVIVLEEKFLKAPFFHGKVKTS